MKPPFLCDIHYIAAEISDRNIDKKKRILSVFVIYYLSNPSMIDRRV